MKYMPVRVEKTAGGYGLPLTDMENGLSPLSVATGQPKTGIKLWHNIKELNIDYFTSDYWKSHGQFIPFGKHM